MACRGVAGDVYPMLVLGVPGNQILYVQPKRLLDRVAEDVCSRLIPEDYSLAFSIRYDGRVADPLEESADPQVLEAHALKSNLVQRTDAESIASSLATSPLILSRHPHLCPCIRIPALDAARYSSVCPLLSPVEQLHSLTLCNNAWLGYITLAMLATVATH